MLSPFEYVTVLISIILGLGITQIVTGVADVVHQWERIKLYWPHLVWMFIIFFLHIQEWWNIYELRLNDTWRLPTFLFISLYPINLFILARLLFPLHHHEDVVLDYKKFYYDNFNKFFLVLILSAILSAIENYSLSGAGLRGIVLQAIIVAVLSFAVLKNIKSETFHKLIVVLWTLVILVSIVVNWNIWKIS